MTKRPYIGTAVSSEWDPRRPAPDIASTCGSHHLAATHHEVNHMKIEGARRGGVAAVFALLATTAVQAQQPSAPGSAAAAPVVGHLAPDFSLPGATRFGLLKDPVKLSDYRGQTVVVAFFARARTRG